MKILNLTQHKATPEQLAAGVADLPDAEREELIELLTFAVLPGSASLYYRAGRIAAIAAEAGVSAAMIGGAPYLMAPLEDALRRRGIRPLYAFSVRESVEETLSDGTVRKTAVFRHQGFVEAAVCGLDEPEEEEA